MMHLARTVAALLVLVVSMSQSAAAAPADALDYSPAGIIRAGIDWPREVPLDAGLWIVPPEWQGIVRQDGLRERKRVAGKDGGFTLTGQAAFGDARIDVRATAVASHIDYLCTAVADADFAGVYWFASIPIDRFAGGSVVIAGKSVPLTKATSAEQRELLVGRGDRVTARSADGKVQLEFVFNAAQTIRVQDASAFGDPSFQIYVPLVERTFKRGQTAALGVTVKTTISPDASDATVTIDANTALTDFDGFGGNFVYGADSPVTRATLDALKLTWARIPLELREWEPANDNGDATSMNTAALVANDVPGSKLRKRFELDQELFKRSEGRMIASVWYLPEWLFAEPIKAGGWRDSAGVVPRERRDELAECVVSYLVRLRDTYGVEPRLFSFNESDYGVYVKLDGEEMRDLARQLAKSFAKAGLKTKLLLGDSASLKKGLEQIAPTLTDEEARGFVGALAYHPWAGENDQWEAWAALAERHHLPLMTTEMGADAGAWEDGSFRTPIYALRLARRYVEQLALARSRALLEWEWTDDFAMTDTIDGKQQLSPRGQWLRQLTQRSPQFAKLLKTTTDRETIRAATIARGDAWAVHLVNLDATRTVHVKGLPAGITKMTLSMVDPKSGAQADMEIAIRAGTADVRLPEAAMATLSTAPGAH